MTIANKLVGKGYSRRLATKQVIMEAEQGINLSRPFNSVEELGEDLNADDQISQ